MKIGIIIFLLFCINLSVFSSEAQSYFTGRIDRTLAMHDNDYHNTALYLKKGRLREANIFMETFEPNGYKGKFFYISHMVGLLAEIILPIIDLEKIDDDECVEAINTGLVFADSPKSLVRYLLIKDINDSSGDKFLNLIYGQDGNYKFQDNMSDVIQKIGNNFDKLILLRTIDNK